MASYRSISSVTAYLSYAHARSPNAHYFLGNVLAWVSNVLSLRLTPYRFIPATTSCGASVPKDSVMYSHRELMLSSYILHISTNYTYVVHPLHTPIPLSSVTGSRPGSSAPNRHRSSSCKLVGMTRGPRTTMRLYSTPGIR
jgi:hypothetical protein